MISKRISMKSVGKSSFAGLASYITGTQGKTERIGNVTITNCQSHDVVWAVQEIQATQQKNKRAETDKTYHLLISFPPGEVPSLEVLQQIEQRLCESIGYGEHQRISAIHNDTDSLHIHVAINKIHPERLTIHEPYYDYPARDAMCAKLEVEFGLQRIDRSGPKKSAAESRAEDMEKIAGVESMLGWIKRECLPQLKSAQSWDQLHQALRENGLVIKPQGNGFVVTNDGGVAVKASSIDRELSKAKLEAKFGAFEEKAYPHRIPPTPPAPKPAEHARRSDRTTAATVAPKSLNELTDPRQIVTIYRGEGEGNTKNGEWWTFDREKAERFAAEHSGTVRQIDVKAGDLARIAAVGHGGADELVVDAARLEALAVDRAALERARARPMEKPPVAKVGEKPPAFRRGKHRGIDQLDQLHIDSGKVQQAANQNQRRSRPAPPIAKVGENPPAFRRGNHQSVDQIDQLQIDSGKRYVPRPMAARVDTTELYALYKSQQGNATAGRAKEWADARERKNARIEAAKRAGRLKRAATKLLGESGPQKRLIYALTSKALRADIEKINAEYMQERQTIFEKYQRQAWADWLQKEARAGNAEALAALRAREARNTGNRNGVRGQGRRVNARASVPKADTITKGGTVIYRVGQSAIRDDGAELKLSVGAKSDALETALRMAMERYGARITVNGTDEFKAQIALVAAKAKLSLTFDDPALESRRQALLRNTHTAQEQQHERDRSRDRRGTRRERVEHTRGRSVSREHIASGRAAVAAQRSAGAAALIESVRAARQDAAAASARVASERRSDKPGVARVGAKPPAFRQNRLRNLSELGLVRIGDGAEVLLPRDVSRDVERQGTQRNDGLRRADDRTGAGVRTDAQRAAWKYIAEREEKRAKGFDIPKHKLYNDRDEGPATYAGTRQSEGQFLALLKRDEEVTVMPVSEAVARSLKRLKLGDAVSVAPNGALDTGAVKKRGRSR